MRQKKKKNNGFLPNSKIGTFRTEARKGGRESFCKIKKNVGKTFCGEKRNRHQ
jgi:hypothetical protein